MSLLDIFSRKRESVHIEAKSTLILPGSDQNRKVVCYRCDRELGEDHDDERCARKGTTRRVFFGRMAATAVGAAVVAKVAPELLTESSQSKPVHEIAAEIGLFGEKTKELLSGIEIARRRAKPFAGFVVRRGDVLEVGPGVKKVHLGYQYDNVPEHPLMPRHIEFGLIETFVPKDGKIKVPHDMRIFTAYDADDDVRVALTIVRPEEADSIRGGVLIGVPPPEKSLTDLEAYIEKRRAEGVKFDDTWTLAGRDKIRERVWHNDEHFGSIQATPFASERALMRERSGGIAGLNWNLEYHPSRNRSRSMEPPLAKPVGYLPA